MCLFLRRVKDSFPFAPSRPLTIFSLRSFRRGSGLFIHSRNTGAISYCGLSCDHCFLGEWCGGCRSVFSYCSFGTLHEKGKCPNIACCEEKGIDGCYECGELDNCAKGFYQNGSDGRAAKAQALFIRKNGKEKLLHAHDKLNEVYDFKKAQELLGTDVKTGLKILENENDGGENHAEN